MTAILAFLKASALAGYFGTILFLGTLKSPESGQSGPARAVPTTTVASPITAPRTTTPPLAVDMVRSCDDALRMAVQEGWPAEELATLSVVLFRESACKPWAFNPRDVSGGSRGLLQLNGAHCLPTAWRPAGFFQTHGLIEECDDLFNPRLNLRAGLFLFNFAEKHYGNGWQPWVATAPKGVFNG
jgi:hypothetical protein